MFSREDLFKEFKSHLMYGFLEGICLFSTVYESQLKKMENQDDNGSDHHDYDVDVRPRYSDYKDAVVAMIGDVIRLKFQGEAAPKAFKLEAA